MPQASITELMDEADHSPLPLDFAWASDGTVVAQYEYGPFGELVRASGPLARSFNFLFSTKYHDWETGLSYYGHRYYNPTTGRWPSRDPINEPGFQILAHRIQPFNLHEENNLYRFAFNDALNKYDPDGRVVPAVPVVVVIAGSVAIEYGVRVYCICGFRRGQEAYVRAPSAILAHFSGVITATIETFCNSPGTIRLHLWKDQKGDCHDRLVVICIGKERVG